MPVSASPRSARATRNDVTAIINPDGSWVERYRYDAYGRPSSFSVADLTGNNGTPDGVVDAADQAAFDAAYNGGAGAVSWKTQASTHLGRNEPGVFTDSVSGNPDPQFLVAKAGMTTRDDTTTSSTYGYRFTYDAWGRIVKVKTQDDSATVSEYRYNGLGHRIASKARHNPSLTYANNPWRYPVCSGAERTNTGSRAVRSRATGLLCLRLRGLRSARTGQHVASFQGTGSSSGACLLAAHRVG